MASREVDSIRSLVGWRSSRTAVAALALLLASGAAGAGQAGHDPRLSATLVGSLEPGETGRLAVRWDGERGALLDAWVDLDGDGRRTAAELVIDGRPLAGGIDVVDFNVPADALVASEPRVWAAVREEGWRQTPASGAEAAGDGSREACGWQPGFFVADLDGTVRSMTVFDDGSGPALYVGGEFIAAGGVVANHVARWDGTAWSALSGPSGTGVDGSVQALAVFDDGTGSALYAGGDFHTAGGVTVNYVARWDATAWSALSGPSGTGMSGNEPYTRISALAVFDDGTGPALYAGGHFTFAGGVTVNHIARWDGVAWSALSGPSETGFNGHAYALAVFDDGSGPALYAGGVFITAGGVTVNNVARWDGNTWSALSGPAGTGMATSIPDETSVVCALAVYDDGSGLALYAGGYFMTAGGLTANNVARWDGAAWSFLRGPHETGTNSTVMGLAVFDDGYGPALFAGGEFSHAGGVGAVHVARWDGGSWSAVGDPSGALNRPVYALAVFDAGSGLALCAGGSFTSAGGMPVGYIARWDGTAWSALSGAYGTGMSESVTALFAFDDGSGLALYAGGYFATAGGVTVNNIARWEGSSWSALSGASGGGVSDAVRSLTVFDDGFGPALYGGGYFAAAGGVTVNRVARWDGVAWSALIGPSATGVNGYVYALAAFDDGTGPALYAGGTFTTAGGVTVNSIARWDGTTWSALSGPSGTGVNDRVNALAVFDDGSGPALYAGGTFTTAGGVTVNYVARWDGTAWSALNGPSGTGVDDYVYALAVFDAGTGPALYAGGEFHIAGGVTVNHVARWDGTTWSGLSGPGGTGLDNGVYALAVFDDGSGPALYAGGLFTTASGVTVNHVARWDGNAWSALDGPSGTGVNYSVFALAGIDDDSGPALYAGGSFTIAGGLVSHRIAAWRCPPPSIFADGFETGDTSAWAATVP